MVGSRGVPAEDQSELSQCPSPEPPVFASSSFFLCIPVWSFSNGSGYHSYIFCQLYLFAQSVIAVGRGLWVFEGGAG